MSALYRVSEYQDGRWVKVHRFKSEWCDGHYHSTKRGAEECEDLRDHRNEEE